MLVSKVINKVNRTVNSGGCDCDSEVIELLNEMVSDITESRNIPLPGFETSQTVSCDGYKVIMPVKFSQNLFAASVSGRKVWICPAMRSLLRRFPTEDATVCNNDLYVCVSGKYLEVRPSFTGDIKLFFYTSPGEIRSSSDELPFGDEVPSFLQGRLAHSYCCKELYSDIEDGVEGPSVNMDKFEERYEIAIDKLRRILKHGQSRPGPVRDEYTFQRI